ncbi:MgtC/SapB family protein [Nitratifractor sp.]
MNLAPELVHFILTVTFGFLIGLEIRSYREHFHPDRPKDFFGTARTYTFIAILGYIFYRLDPERLILYTTLLVGLTLLYAIFYYRKVQENRHSILLYLVMLVVYSFGPLMERFPIWMATLLFVLTVFVLNAKPLIERFSSDFNTYEFETLGKMVLLSAVILPILPDRNVIPYIPLSPFKIWLAVVVISGISYGGYLAQKYFFPNRGYFLTGIIGGTYSSTATTVVLARKAQAIGGNPLIDASIIAATSMMYLRLIVVALIFNFSVGMQLLVPFTVLALLGFLFAAFYIRRGRRAEHRPDFVDRNPLELRTAFLFALLFVLMMVITEYVTRHYGSGGLKALSFLVGFTDIDPFVLSILTGKYALTLHEIVAAIIIAAGSNNLLKAVYALWFGGKVTWRSALWICVLGIVTIGYGWVV